MYSNFILFTSMPPHFCWDIGEEVVETESACQFVFSWVNYWNVMFGWGIINQFGWFAGYAYIAFKRVYW